MAEKPEKYFMLTAGFEKEGKTYTYADVYDDFSKLKQSYKEIKEKIPNLKAWLLTPVSSSEDMVITMLEGKWVACIGPKKELPKDKFIKVKTTEIRIKQD